MSNPLFSIITVVRNGEDEIRPTIESVLNQTCTDYEFIIIDGKSTDRTPEIIRSYGNKITKYISESDSGIYDAMNKGLKLVSGTWVNFLNCGDSFVSESVLDTLVQSNWLSDHTDILYGNMIYSGKEGTRTVKPAANIRWWRGMPICHQSTFVRNSIYQQQNYSLDYRISGDYQFFYRQYMQHAVFQYLDLDVAYFTGGGISETRFLLALKENYRIARTFENSFKVHNYYLNRILNTYKKQLFQRVGLRK